MSMQPPSSSVMQRRLAWLLWLALLLPLAQGAAAWHGYTHVQSAIDDGSRPAQKDALHGAHCELCLMASSIGVGGLPAVAAAADHGSARHAAPAGSGTRATHARSHRSYLSRAPPLALL